MKNILRSGILVLVICFAFAGIAQNDTFDSRATANPPLVGWTATATLTASGGTWSQDFIFNNNTAKTVDEELESPAVDNAEASESFSIGSSSQPTLTGGGSVVTGNFFADDNNGGSPDCNSTSTKGWLCADTSSGGTLNPQQINAGGTLDFGFSETYTGTTPVQLDLMASGCVARPCFLDGGTSNDNKWAISGTGTTKVPEPASLTLLGLSGLLGVPFLRRRK